MITTAKYPTDFLVPVDEREYHAEKMLSSHRLITFIKNSPKLYKKELDGLIAKKESADMDFGSALHTMVLEPDLFDERYTVCDGPINDKTGRPYGKETKAFGEWAAQQSKPVISIDDHKKLEAMREGIISNPGPAMLLESGVAEGVAYASYMGYDCKIRPDWITPIHGLTDLKTTADIDRFRWQFIDFRYDIQLAFYREVIKIITGVEMPVHVIVVEKVEPFRSIHYEIGNDWLGPALSQINIALEKMKECEKSGVWPTGLEGTHTLYKDTR